MSAPDLHPEELLDKAAIGELSDTERAWLDSHLAQCAVCRFELQARRDFEAAPVTGLAVDSLVARALAGVPSAAPATLPRRRRDLRGLVAIAAALSAVASFAAVRYSDGISQVIQRVLGTAEPVVAPPPPSFPGVRHVAPTPPPAVEPEPEAPLEPTPEPEVTRAPPPPEPVKPVLRVAKAPVIAHEEHTERSAALPPPPLPPSSSAMELFTAANRARAHGQAEEASRLYRELVAQYPDSSEGRISHVLLGRLLLDSADAGGALTELEAYAKTGDSTLREEALAARAVASGRLGDHEREAAAWRELLESFPDSVHANRAKVRLEELHSR